VIGRRPVVRDRLLAALPAIAASGRATAEAIATACGVPVQHAARIMGEAWRLGLVERHGRPGSYYYTPAGGEPDPALRRARSEATAKPEARTRLVGVRLTDAEHADLAQRATARGFEVATYARMLLGFD